MGTFNGLKWVLVLLLIFEATSTIRMGDSRWSLAVISNAQAQGGDGIDPEPNSAYDQDAIFQQLYSLMITRDPQYFDALTQLKDLPASDARSILLSLIWGELSALGFPLSYEFLTKTYDCLFLNATGDLAPFLRGWHETALSYLEQTVIPKALKNNKIRLGDLKRWQKVTRQVYQRLSSTTASRPDSFAEIRKYFDQKISEMKDPAPGNGEITEENAADYFHFDHTRILIKAEKKELLAIEREAVKRPGVGRAQRDSEFFDDDLKESAEQGFNEDSEDDLNENKPSSDKTSSTSKLDQSPLSRFIRLIGQSRFSGADLSVLRAGIGAGSVEIVNQRIQNDRKAGRYVEPIGLESLREEVIDLLVREKGKFPTVIGAPRVGKNRLVDAITDAIMQDRLAPGVVRDEFVDAIVLRTTSAQWTFLASQKQYDGWTMVLEYFEAVEEIERVYHIPVIVIVDEIEHLTAQQAGGLEQVLKKSQNPPHVVLLGQNTKNLSNPGGYEAAQSLHLVASPSLGQMIHLVPFDDYSLDVKTQILIQSYIPEIEKKNKVKISEKIARAAVDQAKELEPSRMGIEGGLNLLQDMAIALNKQHGGLSSEATVDDLYAMAAKRLYAPAVPEDLVGFNRYIEGLKSEVNGAVIGQEPTVNGTLDLWTAAQRSSKKKHAVVSITGTTGVGKTFIGQTIGAKRFKDKPEHVLEIDMSQFGKNAEQNMTKLFGAGPTWVGYGDGAILCNWADKIGAAGGVLILNEMDKVEGEVFNKLMNMLETGVIDCGDMKPRSLGRSLVILTSNRNVKNIVSDQFLRTASCAEIDKKVDSLTRKQLTDLFTQGEAYANKGKEVAIEALARVDGFFFARPMCAERAIQAMKASLVKISKSDYERKNQGRLIFDPVFVQNWVDLAYDPVSGFRPFELSISSQLSTIVTGFRGKFGNASDELSFKLVRNPAMPFMSTITVSDTRGNSMDFKGPRGKMTSPLLDPIAREKILHIEEQIGEQILGQEQMVHMAANILRSMKVNPNAEEPQSAYIIGPTGTGKSEIAKVIAEIEFGSRDDAFTINMGDISFAYRFEEWFNPFDKVGPLEEFLKKHEDGGVLLFDEMSNAGGDDRSQRWNIAVKLYEILQSGKYTSNASGKVYDLRKFLQIFTGNTGQEFFYGLSTDDELQSTWKAVGDTPAKNRKLLVEDGLPPAFLGRIPNVIMAMPLLGSVKDEIAQKAIDRWLAQMKKSQPVIPIELAPGFVHQVGSLVYNSKEGARSINSFLTSEVSSLVGEAVPLIDIEKTATGKAPAKVVLTIESQGPTVPFYEGDPQPKIAKLQMTAIQGGQNIFSKESDFVDKAHFMEQIPKDDAWAVAFHEAGHAIGNKEQLTRQKLSFVTIIPSKEGGYLGYARFEILDRRKADFTEIDLIEVGARLMAGSMAEKLIGRLVDGKKNTGWSQDLKMLNSAILWYGIRGGLCPKLTTLRFDPKGEPIFITKQQRLDYEAYFRMIQDKSEARAEVILRERWPEVVRVARALMEKGYLYGAQFDEIVKKYSELSPLDQANLKRLYTPEKTATKFNAYQKSCQELLATKAA